MIPFNDKDWERVRITYRKWWNNELGRPILPCVYWGRNPGRTKPKNELLSFSNCNDLSVSPEEIIDRYDYELSCYEYAGDSFPIMQMMQFGPGVAAAFLGADLETGENTVWFHPKKIVPVEDLHFEYDPDNVWLRRVKDIYRAGMKKWGGNVAMGMADLGGALDLLAVFRTTEGLLFDLYDKPEEVKRLVGELHDLWLRFYGEIGEILRGSQGFTDWGSIYYEKPTYMLQCDFAYMIGTDMFEEFALEELKQTAEHFGGAFYHLDGIGQLRHLDALLNAEAIKGIQWVPGEGEPRTRDWSDVYRKIGSRYKKIQAYYDLDTYLDEILEVLPCPDLLVKMQFGYPIERKKEITERLARYGVESL